MWEHDDAALASFCDGGSLEFTPELRRIVSVSAESGKYWHGWHRFRQLLHFRLNQVVKEIGSSSPSNVTVTANAANNAASNATNNATNNANGSDGEKGLYDVLKRLGSQLASFEDAAPFTLQRICELLLQPSESYSRIDKFELAFERLLLVTSTLAVSPDPSSYPGLAAATATATATENDTTKETEMDTEREAKTEKQETSAEKPE